MKISKEKYREFSFLGLVLLLFTLTPLLVEGQNWWNASWSERQAIFIEGGNSSLTNFTVFIKMPFSHFMKTNFSDIRFLDQENNELGFEKTDVIEGNLGQFWVMIPQLSPGENIIYAYYGNPSALQDNDPKLAYDFNHVYHFSSQDMLIDSAGNNNCSLVGAVDVEDGIFGKSIVFDGNDYYNCGDTSQLAELEHLTLLTFVRPRGTGLQRILDKNEFNLQTDGSSPKTLDTSILKLDGSRTDFYKLGALSENFYHQIVTEYTGELILLWRDGENLVNASHSGAIPGGAGPLIIADAQARNGQRWIGEMDEIWISNKDYKGDWINRWLENKNPNKIKFGAEEPSINFLRFEIIIHEPKNQYYTSLPLIFRIEAVLNVTDNENIFCSYNVDENDARFNMSLEYGNNFTANIQELSEGQHTVTFFCETPQGGKSNASQKFILDTTSPRLLCPENLQVECESPQGQLVSIGHAEAVDNVDTSVMITNNAPLLFPLGETQVTWNASDAAGHTASCQQTILIRDATPPKLVCPAPITATEGEKINLSISVADTCSTEITLSNTIPVKFPVGTTPVIWSAVDAQGNTNQCTTEVTIISNNSNSNKTQFKRGDSNGDGSVDISDPIFTLLYLFANRTQPKCLDALDANDDGSIDISDPQYLLNFLFKAGPAPRPPYPTLGNDPTPDTLTCTDYNSPAGGGGGSVQTVKEALNQTKNNQALENETKSLIVNYLEFIPKGSLSITSYPTGASIYLDGSYKGLTPRAIINLTSGNYTLKLIKSGYKTKTSIVNIQSGKITKISETLFQETAYPTASPTPYF